MLFVIKLWRVKKLGDGLLNLSPYGKTNFRDPGNVQGQNGFGQCLGHCCPDFNTGKNHGVALRKFGTKNFPPPKSMTKLEALTVVTWQFCAKNIDMVLI
jgi:hypothetical protein